MGKRIYGPLILYFIWITQLLYYRRWIKWNLSGLVIKCNGICLLIIWVKIVCVCVCVYIMIKRTILCVNSQFFPLHGWSNDSWKDQLDYSTCTTAYADLIEGKITPQTLCVSLNHSNHCQLLIRFPSLWMCNPKLCSLQKTYLQDFTKNWTPITSCIKQIRPH